MRGVDVAGRQPDGGSEGHRNKANAPEVESDHDAMIMTQGIRRKLA